jgi:hypothetical protein
VTRSTLSCLLSGTVLPFVLPFDSAGSLSQAPALQGYFINGWAPLRVAPVLCVRAWGPGQGGRACRKSCCGLPL